MLASSTANSDMAIPPHSSLFSKQHTHASQLIYNYPVKLHSERVFHERCDNCHSAWRINGLFWRSADHPPHRLFESWLKHDELESSRKLESIAKQRELLLQHKLEIERRGRGKSVDQISKRLENLENVSIANEIYLVLLTGAGAGVVAAFIGAILLYRNHLRTHSTLHEKVEEERTALQNDLSEMDNEELAETEAGKELMRLSQSSIQQFG